MEDFFNGSQFYAILICHKEKDICHENSLHFIHIFSGNPLPTIRWFLNGRDISLAGYGGGRYRQLDQGQGLEIQKANGEDVGLWTCQAENSAGSSTADISLDVWGLLLLAIYLHIMPWAMAFYLLYYSKFGVS
jgi:hypothetical protein